MTDFHEYLVRELTELVESKGYVRIPTISDQAAFFNLLRSVNELNRHELELMNDPSFLKQAERVKELTTTRLVGISKDTIVFRTKSSKFAETGREYTQRVRLVDLDNLLEEYEAGKLTLRDVFELAINSGDIEIYCSCPSFLYWGFQYINTDLDSIIPGREEDRYPDQRNPKLRGMYCKHMQLVLDVLPFNTLRILKRWRQKYV